MKPINVVLLLACFLVGVQARSQTNVVASDPAAIAIAEQATAAMGGPQALLAYQDSVAKGVLKVNTGNSSLQLPIIIKSKGTKLVKVELQQKTGVTVRILNAGHGAIQKPDGKIRKLITTNTIAERVTYIPLLSLLAEYQSSQVAVRYVGASQVDGALTKVIALSYIPTTDPVQSKAFDQITRCQFFIDAATGVVVRMQYSSFAENHSNNSSPVEIRYSDYRNISGMLVPFRQVTYMDGRLESDLVLQSAVFNVGLSDSEFQLPQ